MFCTLAFLSTNVINCFVGLCPEIRSNFNHDAVDLLGYFKDTYIGRFFKNAPQRIPLFFTNLWDMFNRTNQEIPKSNNSIKGSNQIFQGPGPTAKKILC